MQFLKNNKIIDRGEWLRPQGSLITHFFESIALFAHNYDGILIRYEIPTILYIFVHIVYRCAVMYQYPDYRYTRK